MDDYNRGSHSVDNRRPYMKKLASDMGVGYFDRPDNKGAKAGNLNNALSRRTLPI